MTGGADMMPLIVGEDAPVEAVAEDSAPTEPETKAVDVPLDGEVVATPSDHKVEEKA